METTDKIITTAPQESAFKSVQGFEDAQRIAKMLCTSDMIPKRYQNNIQNTMIAMEMSNRTGANILMVMQNLDIIQGKPSWSSAFIIAALNTCGRFSPVKFELKGEGMDRSCTAWAIETATGERLEGPTITMQMAKAEGWLDKPGSKWKTMPELMLRYRSAAFFGRLYCPEILMGLSAQDEAMDKGQVRDEITVEQLKDLRDFVLAELTSKELKDINRIIDNNEVASFKKAQTLMLSKNGSNDQK